MKHLSFFFAALFVLFSQSSSAQLGWKWARATSYSTYPAPPFEENWLQAVTPHGYVYTVSATGSQSGPPIIIGTTTHFGPLSVVDSTNCAQMTVAKIDSNGNYLWVLGTQHSDVSPSACTSDDSGNLYILGLYDSVGFTLGGVYLSGVFPSYHKMFFITKITPAGTVAWSHNVCPSAGGGIGDIVFTSGAIKVDRAGNIYVVGSFWTGTVTIGSTTLTNSTSGFDLVVAKFDPLGNPIWAKGFDNIQNFWGGLCAAVSPEGNLCVSGIFTNNSITFGTHTLTSSTGYGMFVTMLDSSGAVKWAKGYEGGMNNVTNSMVMDEKQRVYITGAFSYVLNLDHDTLLSLGANDIFLACFDSVGDCKWGKRAGGSGDDQGFSIALDQRGQLWTVGNMGGGLYSAGYTADFDSYTLIESGGAPIWDPLYIAKYDTMGHAVSVSMILGGGDDWCSIAVDNKGSFYICGDWLEATVGFGPDTLTGLTTHEEHSFIAKYRYDTTFYTLGGHAVEQTMEPVSVYPNPVTNELTIKTGCNDYSSFTIVNSVGQMVRPRQELAGCETTVDMGNLPRGLYYVLLRGSAGVNAQKVVKM